MLDIQDVKLEFLRHGPAHNQLLSPLTTYLALCGADGPASVNVPFEHLQLTNRLNRLRYEINGVQVEASQRQGELRELGEDIAGMLGRIPAIGAITRLSRANSNQLLNIRLVVSANELSLLPFEATMAPDQTGSSGAPLLLSSLTTITREIRRGQPLPVHWDRRPRILFAFASPDGYPAVPAQEHLEALRRAIDPWVKKKRTQEEQLEEVQCHLTVLQNASIKMIRDECLKHEYTHVHILAHGAPIPGSQDLRYGVVLASDDTAQPFTVVDGPCLAYALKGVRRDDQAVSPPSVVTLSTCDSGNAGTGITPGGSIAHELHSNDVPWVIASQFPLWIDASVKAADVLYNGLLSGRDPRVVMYEVRQRLRVDHPDTHDWASLVAYAAIPADFNAQVRQFRSRQTRRRMNVKFDRMDDLIAWKERRHQSAIIGPSPFRQDPPPSDNAILINEPESEAAAKAEINALAASIRQALRFWADDPAVQADLDEVVERLGMQAAAEKRIAIGWHRYLEDIPDPTDAPPGKSAAPAHGEASISQAYDNARKLYRKAMLRQPASHWVVTQFLSLSAVCARRKHSSSLQGQGKDWKASLDGLRHWWHLAHDVASSLSCGRDEETQTWALGTLAELELLGALFVPPLFDDPEDRDPHRMERNIAAHCRAIVELCDAGSFSVKSTARQFRRYVSVWEDLGLSSLALVALEVLEGGG